MNLPLILAEEAFLIVAVGGGIFCAIIGTITSAIRKTRVERYREESRREIAAYVAEGSITPDDGAKLLNAGKSWADKLGS